MEKAISETSSTAAYNLIVARFISNKLLIELVQSSRNNNCRDAEHKKLESNFRNVLFFEGHVIKSRNSVGSIEVCVR